MNLGFDPGTKNPAWIGVQHYCDGYSKPQITVMETSEIKGSTTDVVIKNMQEMFHKIISLPEVRYNKVIYINTEKQPRKSYLKTSKMVEALKNTITWLQTDARWRDIQFHFKIISSSQFRSWYMFDLPQKTKDNKRQIYTSAKKQSVSLVLPLLLHSPANLCGCPDKKKLDDICDAVLLAEYGEGNCILYAYNLNQSVIKL